MRLSCAQFNVLVRAGRGTLTKQAASPSLERTVRGLTMRDLLKDWEITDKGRALLELPYYRQPDDSVIIEKRRAT